MQKKHFAVRSWPRSLLLAPVLAVIFALMLVLPAFADTVSNTTETVNFTIVNACNGEVVAVTVTFHDVYRVTLDSSGGFHLGSHENDYGSGVGSLGNKYQINATFNNKFNGNVGQEETATAKIFFVSQGSAPNDLDVKNDYHLTVNPDGTVTSFHDNFRSECLG